MKKILFNDKYSLTQAVLDGRKTMTRRVITYPSRFRDENIAGLYRYGIVLGDQLNVVLYDADERIDSYYISPKYKVGEVLAIAQSYESLGMNPEIALNDRDGIGFYTKTKFAPGWKNKMFVCADLMPHHIRITGIKIEKLQGISDEDCLKEGIGKYFIGFDSLHTDYMGFTYSFDESGKYKYPNAKQAFAALIDKVSGKGAWSSNPYVFVYEFKLVD